MSHIAETKVAFSPPNKSRAITVDSLFASRKLANKVSI